MFMCTCSCLYVYVHMFVLACVYVCVCSYSRSCVCPCACSCVCVCDADFLQLLDQARESWCNAAVIHPGNQPLMLFFLVSSRDIVFSAICFIHVLYLFIYLITLFLIYVFFFFFCIFKLFSRVRSNRREEIKHYEPISTQLLEPYLKILLCQNA